MILPTLCSHRWEIERTDLPITFRWVCLGCRTRRDALPAEDAHRIGPGVTQALLELNGDPDAPPCPEAIEAAINVIWPDAALLAKLSPALGRAARAQHVAIVTRALKAAQQAAHTARSQNTP